MTPLNLAKELLNYIKTLQTDQNLNNWICKGKTDIAYGTPTGSWGKQNGYLFEKKNKSFSYVLRSDVEHNGNKYIVIESVNLKGQLYNLNLSNPKTFRESQGQSYLLESYRMTVGTKKKEVDVENSFKSLGINTNEISVIDDLNPDWSKIVTDILEWSIIREKVKLDLKSNNKVMETSFAQIIEDFKVFIKEEETKIKNFSFQKTYPKYVWINDSELKIGTDGFCHYELITRNKYPKKIFAEIHFEGKHKKRLKELISAQMNDNVFWNNDHKGGELSLAFRENYDFEDENLFSKLADALYYLESNFGDLIRTEFKNIFTISHSSNHNMIKQPLNQILYGPPGTGKTYNTINKAISIIDASFNLTMDRNLIKAEYDRLVEEGQIVFTTFHQSMSYEDFIEGIKPETKNEKVVYNVQDGILKKIIKTALIAYLEKDNSSDKEDSFDSLYKEYVDSIKSSAGTREPLFTTKTGVEVMLVDANENSILVKYLWGDKKKGQEGKQVFTVSKDKLKKTLFEGIIPVNVKNLKEQLHPLIGHIHCELFAVYKHFYDFVVTNKGEIDAVHYDYEDLSFKEVKEQYDLLDKNTIKDKLVKPYVIIIDEINRGNVSAIFGELITLIEEDKRLDKDEALEVTLSYSKEKFGIPSNLYIIGTMNTADRSVEALDTALRRRFCFEEMLPKKELLKGFSSSNYCKLLWEYENVKWDISPFIEKEEAFFKLYGKPDGIDQQKEKIWNTMKEENNKTNYDYFKGFEFGLDLSKLLETINNRIEILLDRDHTIGHSYFIKVNDKNDLRNTFKNNIIPLLQEYFYGDYDKIGMIIGKDFFEESKKFDKNIFASFDTQQFPENGTILRMKTIDENFDIITAVESLLNIKKFENITENA